VTQPAEPAHQDAGDDEPIPTGQLWSRVRDSPWMILTTGLGAAATLVSFVVGVPERVVDSQALSTAVIIVFLVLIIAALVASFATTNSLMSRRCSPRRVSC
jgi:hypothetical protein